MNYVILSILLIASLSLIITIPDSFAEIEKGYDYNKQILQTFNDGSQKIKWTSTPPKLLDHYDYQGKPVYYPFKTWETDTHIYFESASFSYAFIKSSNTLELFDGGKLTTKPLKLKLHHTLKEAINGTDTWNNLTLPGPFTTWKTTLNGIQIISNEGDFQTIYDIDHSYGFEYTYKYTNNDLTKTDHKYGFSSICDGSACNNFKMNNQLISNGAEISKETLKDKNLKLGSISLDLKEETHNYTWALKKQPDKVIIDFTNSKGKLSIGETLIVDPTYTNSAPTAYNPRTGSPPATSACSTTGTTAASPTTQLYLESSGSTSNYCSVIAFSFDTTSIDDNISSVSDSTWGFTIITVGNPRNCDVTEVTVNPSTATIDQIYDDVRNDPSGSVWVNNNSFCTSTGAKTLDLGTAFDTNVDTLVSSGNNKITLGMVYDDMVRDGSYHEVASIGSHTLTIIYLTTPAPYSITTLSISSITQTTASASFSAPNLRGESLINYMLNVTTPQANKSTLFYTNSSLTTIPITGLTLSTGYTAQASAYTAGGGNWTLANVFNFTTSTFIPPGAPTLTGLALSDSALRFTSIAGSVGDNSTKDYGLQCELNNSGTWLNTVNNSTLPPGRIYEYTGLTLGDSLICQWRDGSADGFSNWSNNATDTLSLAVLSAQRTILTNPDDKLLLFINFVTAQGGVYFGLGALPFGVMLIGFLAGKKTVRIFTLATLFLMGIIHASGYYVYENWYWTLALLFGIVLVMGRMKSD